MPFDGRLLTLAAVHTGRGGVQRAVVAQIVGVRTLPLPWPTVPARNVGAGQRDVMIHVQDDVGGEEVAQRMGVDRRPSLTWWA